MLECDITWVSYWSSLLSFLKMYIFVRNGCRLQLTSHHSWWNHQFVKPWKYEQLDKSVQTKQFLTTSLQHPKLMDCNKAVQQQFNKHGSTSCKPKRTLDCCETRLMLCSQFSCWCHGRTEQIMTMQRVSDPSRQLTIITILTDCHSVHYSLVAEI